MPHDEVPHLTIAGQWVDTEVHQQADAWLRRWTEYNATETGDTEAGIVIETTETPSTSAPAASSSNAQEGVYHVEPNQESDTPAEPLVVQATPGSIRAAETTASPPREHQVYPRSDAVQRSIAQRVDPLQYVNFGASFLER